MFPWGRFVSVGLFLCCFWVASGWCAKSPSDIYADQVRRFVKDGHVDYTAWKKETERLNVYLDFLAKDNPTQMSRDVQIAYYINVYNAWVVELVLDHFPGLRSIKDIGGFFQSPGKIKFIKIGERTVSLSYIKNDIIRKRYDDPRILFALNTATKGCPPLIPEVYEGAELERQLNRVTRNYINNQRINYMREDTLYLSKMFTWYEEDFGGYSGMVRFLQQYIRPEWKARIESLGDNLRIRYVDYDWALNGD